MCFQIKGERPISKSQVPQTLVALKSCQKKIKTTEYFIFFLNTDLAKGGSSAFLVSLDAPLGVARLVSLHGVSLCSHLLEEVG